MRKMTKIPRTVLTERVSVLVAKTLWRDVVQMCREDEVTISEFMRRLVIRDLDHRDASYAPIDEMAREDKCSVTMLGSYATEFIGFKISPQDWVRIKNFCRHEGINSSRYLRYLIWRELERRYV